MNPEPASILSIAALIISLVALFFTFRKDAHRIRLEVTPGEYWTVVLGVNNDSACDAEVLSVGYFDASGKVTWIPHVGEYRTNRWVDYPILVKARSLCVIPLIFGREIPSKDTAFGYCVQLATGRIYVLRGSAPFGTSFRFHLASLLSRLSGGRYAMGISRVRLPSRR